MGGRKGGQGKEREEREGGDAHIRP